MGESTTLRNWVRESRKQEGRNPLSYLGAYSGSLLLVNFDDQKLVLMTQETFDKIERHCGRYDGTFPTGEYLGKMFLRGRFLFWIGIHKEKPHTHIAWNSRKVVIIDGR